MIITIVCDVLGEENNGTTVAAANLIRCMKARGHEVRVLCADKARQNTPGYYVVPELKLLPPISNYVAKVGVDIAAPNLKVMKQAMDHADIVHIMTPFLLGTAALYLARKLHLPVTAGFHCQAENFTSHLHLMNLPAANDMTYKVMHDIFYRHVDCIHYPTRFIRDIYEGKTGSSRGVVISNGVSPLFHSMPAVRPEEYQDRFLILNTGRYAEEKSQHILLEAVRLSAHEKEIQVFLAGQGPFYDKLKKQGNDLTNPPVMALFSREELAGIANYADLYVHAAEVDLEAIACLEAISCGLVPVIADSPRCATKNFALEKTNLFNVNDPASLAARIDYWIEHPQEKAAARIAYLEYAKQFRLEHCMEQMESMMEETISLFLRQNTK
ncbi:MAG: glycosyltransferase [Parasporobacterium sp.]|nr:glycosyltransferase [Parasporobacterium sp.]